jgi:hypothetical protein
MTGRTSSDWYDLYVNGVYVFKLGVARCFLGTFGVLSRLSGTLTIKILSSVDGVECVHAYLPSKQ